NAILADDGAVKLLDFGLAKLVDAQMQVSAFDVARQPGDDVATTLPDSTPDPTQPSLDQTVPEAGSPVETTPSPKGTRSPSLTRAGAFMGTPLYMAPELWRSEPATPRSDVYSLGVLLYWLSTGHTPHSAKNLPDLM